MDKKWWLLYCWGWKRNEESEERVLLIVVVVIDCGVSTTVNTTILLIYMLSTICVIDCLLKTEQILQLSNSRPMILESI